MYVRIAGVERQVSAQEMSLLRSGVPQMFVALPRRRRDHERTADTRHKIALSDAIAPPFAFAVAEAYFAEAGIEGREPVSASPAQRISPHRPAADRVAAVLRAQCRAGAERPGQRQRGVDVVFHHWRYDSD